MQFQKQSNVLWLKTSCKWTLTLLCAFDAQILMSSMARVQRASQLELTTNNRNQQANQITLLVWLQPSRVWRMIDAHRLVAIATGLASYLNVTSLFHVCKYLRNEPTLCNEDEESRKLKIKRCSEMWCNVRRNIWMKWTWFKVSVFLLLQTLH